MTERPYRLGIVAYHPIQYQSPLFRRIAAEPGIELEVLYCSAAGAESYWDPGFSTHLRWDLPLRDGFRSSVLPNRGLGGGAGFFGLLNPAVLTIVRRRRFDALIVHGWARATDWLAIVAASASGTPVLLRAEASSAGRTSWWKRPVRQRLLRALFSRVDAFLATGRRGREFYRQHGVADERVFTMPYAVDNGYFMAESERRAAEGRNLRHELGIADGSVVVLFSGKLIPRKRPLDLINALERLTPEVDLTLVFAGEGELRPDLETAVESRGLRNVRFAGFRNQTELPSFYAAADIFVLPSAFETWGLVVNEAMCFGLPVVVSEGVSAAADLVRPGVNGFVYPVGDVAALAENLRLLAGDPDRRAAMGQASRDIISSWSFEEDVCALQSCLAAVAARDPGPS